MHDCMQSACSHAWSLPALRAAYGRVRCPHACLPSPPHRVEGYACGVSDLKIATGSDEPGGLANPAEEVMRRDHCEDAHRLI